MTTLALFLVASAHADTFTVTFCAEYKTDFTDSDLTAPVNGHLDDYFGTNINRIARGARIRLVSTSALSPQKVYADWEGADAGCATFAVSDAYTYDVYIDSFAVIDDVTVKIYRVPGSFWHSKVLNDWVPSASTTIDIETNNAHRSWNFAAAMGWAVKRRRTGLSGETVIAHTDDASPCLGNAACSSGGELWFDNTQPQIDYRYVMVHELGHLLGAFVDGEPQKNYNLAATACTEWPTEDTDSHQMATLEFSSAAAVEGFAHYYAAVAFNKTDESNCAFMYNLVQDFDRNFVGDFFVPFPMNCEGSPTWNSALVGNKDYANQECSSITNKGVELDYLRFLWDMDSDYSHISFSDLVDMWDLANPNSWNATPASNANDVYERLEVGAAQSVASDGDDILDELYIQDNNGIDH